jgi:hypothetical protein
VLLFIQLLKSQLLSDLRAADLQERCGKMFFISLFPNFISTQKQSDGCSESNPVLHPSIHPSIHPSGASVGTVSRNKCLVRDHVVHLPITTTNVIHLPVY